MPMVEVHAIRNVFTPEQKREISAALTETMIRFEGENLRPYTWVRWVESDEGDWMIGGQALDANAVHTIAKGGT